MNNNDKMTEYTATLLVANIKNANGRIYSKETLEQAEKMFREEYKNKDMLGQLNAPTEKDVDIEKITHIVTEIKVNDDKLECKIKVLENTPCGRIVNDMMKEDIPLYISPVGIGYVDNDGKINEYKMLSSFIFENMPAFGEVQKLRKMENKDE